MKSLTDYIEVEQTAIFDKYGVFFAFSKSQLTGGIERLKEKGILTESNKICDIGVGGFCPSKNAKAVMDELDKLYKKGISQDIEENGLSAIIRRELDNYEYCITWDITDTYEALKDYPNVTPERIKQELPTWREMRKARDLD